MIMTYDRLTADNAAVLFVDHQTGLANGVETQTPADFINNVKALVTIAQIYKLPTIITTSAHDGPNGPIMPFVEQGLPNATTVHRPGEVNAFDNAEFKAAVKKLGRKKPVSRRRCASPSAPSPLSRRATRSIRCWMRLAPGASL